MEVFWSPIKTLSSLKSSSAFGKLPWNLDLNSIQEQYGLRRAPEFWCRSEGALTASKCFTYITSPIAHSNTNEVEVLLSLVSTEERTKYGETESLIPGHWELEFENNCVESWACVINCYNKLSLQDCHKKFEQDKLYKSIQLCLTLSRCSINVSKWL